MKSLKNRKNRKNTPNKSDSFPLHNWQKCWLHRTQYMCSMTYGPRASYISYGIHIPRTSHLLRNKNRSKQYAERNHIRVLVNFFPTNRLVVLALFRYSGCIHLSCVLFWGWNSFLAVTMRIYLQHDGSLLAIAFVRLMVACTNPQEQLVLR